MSERLDVYTKAEYRKAVYLNFTVLESPQSYQLTPLRRYVYAYSIESPLDRFFRVDPVRKFYEFLNTVSVGYTTKAYLYSGLSHSEVLAVYGAVSASKQFTDYIPLLDSAVYARTVSPLLAVQLTAYRPRIRYVSYSVSDHYGVYDSFGYVKSASPLLLLQTSVYRPRLRYVYYTASDYYSLYESLEYVKSISPLLLQVSAYRPKIRYATYSATGYERAYDGVKAVKAVFVHLRYVADIYAISNFTNKSVMFAEFAVPYESFKARRVYVYYVNTYEDLHENVEYGRQGYTYGSYESPYEQVKVESD